MPRTIESITITVAPQSVGAVPLAKYVDRLITECYEMPGVVVETEIDVNPGEETTYTGVLKGKPEEAEAFAEEIKVMAEELLASMSGKA